MPFTSKNPTYLTPEQRHALMQIPIDVSDREIARYYTFTQKDLINQKRRPHNRLGFACQIAVLRYPGRPLKEGVAIPPRVLAAIADQVQVTASTFAQYGEREHTLYEHLDEIRRTYALRECRWREYLWLARQLLVQAMESDRPVPLIEQALELLRAEGIIAPTLVHLERLVWVVLKEAEKRLFHQLTLEYFRDESLRRRILIGLDKGEALHALARQIFFGRLGELRDRALEDQMHRASCLHLLMAAITAWNTIYLTEAFAALRRQGEKIAETTVAHIAPLGWEHINLIGKYHFARQPGCSLENLRPLRGSERAEEASQEAAD